MQDDMKLVRELQSSPYSLAVVAIHMDYSLNADNVEMLLSKQNHSLLMQAEKAIIAGLGV